MLLPSPWARVALGIEDGGIGGENLLDFQAALELAAVC